MLEAAGRAALDALPAGLRRREPPALPELSQPEVLRHFLRLSQMTLGDAVVADTLGHLHDEVQPGRERGDRERPEPRRPAPGPARRDRPGPARAAHRFEQSLRAISGFDAFSFQGGAGQPGIFTSALIIRAFHEANGDLDRKREIVTTSYSHPANAAAAAVAGFDVISLLPGERGFPQPTRSKQPSPIGPRAS